MADVTSDDKLQAEGNTKPLPLAARRWCFTINCYTQDELLRLHKLSQKSSVKFYAYQEETGKKGNKHIQGYMEFNGPRRFTTWKNQFPTIHMERSRGSRDQNVKYCNDIKKRTGQAWCTNGVLIDPMEGLEVYKWQMEILSIIKGDGQNRDIYWYWSLHGGTGKSVFAKHLCM